MASHSFSHVTISGRTSEGSAPSGASASSAVAATVAVSCTGGYHKYVSNFSALMGWEGIMIANISNLNPIALLLISLIWGALKTGAMAMERATTLNRLTVNLLQMIFVLCVPIDYEGIFRYFINKKRKKESLAESMRKIEEEKKKEG